MPINNRNLFIASIASWIASKKLTLTKQFRFFVDLDDYPFSCVHIMHFEKKLNAIAQTRLCCRLVTVSRPVNGVPRIESKHSTFANSFICPHGSHQRWTNPYHEIESKRCDHWRQIPHSRLFASIYRINSQLMNVGIMCVGIRFAQIVGHFILLWFHYDTLAQNFMIFFCIHSLL